MRIIKHGDTEIKIITRVTAKRYVQIFGGEIAVLTFLAADGLFDTLRDKHGNRIAVIHN